jgi:hypothetical protein
MDNNKKDYLKKIYNESNLKFKLDYNDFLGLIQYMENTHGTNSTDNIEFLCGGPKKINCNKNTNNFQDTNSVKIHNHEEEIEKNNFFKKYYDDLEESNDLDSIKLEQLLNLSHSEEINEVDDNNNSKNTLTDIIEADSTLSSETTTSFGLGSDSNSGSDSDSDSDSDSSSDSKMNLSSGTTLNSNLNSNLNSESNSDTTLNSDSSVVYLNKLDTKNNLLNSLFGSSTCDVDEQSNKKPINKINIKISPNTKFKVNINISDSIDITIN